MTDKHAISFRRRSQDRLTKAQDIIDSPINLLNYEARNSRLSTM